MTSYINVKVNLSEGQKKKILSALKKKEKVSVRIGHKNLNGNDTLAVTKTQANRISKSKKDGTGVTINISESQLKHNKKIKGGFLGLLAGLAARALPAIASTVLPALGVGALSGLASSGVQKAMGSGLASSEVQEDTGSGLFLKKRGHVCRIETNGKGLYISPYKGRGLSNFGEGLYLKQEGQIYDGKGLLLGPNSPFKNIPLLNILI